jgi:hypothetical protein
MKCAIQINMPCLAFSGDLVKDEEFSVSSLLERANINVGMIRKHFMSSSFRIYLTYVKTHLKTQDTCP